MEAEVAARVDEHAHVTDGQGRRQMVRNGHPQPPTVVTGPGPVEATMPRVYDRREEPERERFTSSILPPYLRTTNPIASMFSTARLRTDKTKGCGSRVATLTMVFKLAESAQARWRRLNGIAFKNGEKQAA